VHARLQDHRPRQGARLGNRTLLQGRLRCAPCGCTMVAVQRAGFIDEPISVRLGGCGPGRGRPIAFLTVVV
jgi:hypothetical protein